MCFKTTTIDRHPVQTAIILLFSLCVFISGSGWGEVIDRIVAVVNDKVITLTDINIIAKFGLFEDLEEDRERDLQKLILDRLIDQKLVIQLTSERVVVGEEELEAFLSDIIQKIDPGLAEKALLQFGLDWDDLKSYLREKLLYQKIISQRFDRGVIVSIEEIERYYEQVYIPSQRERNLDPQPMIEVLDRIESALKREKVKGQVRGWIDNLKREANIQIKIS
jgi:hypothetical protein